MKNNGLQVLRLIAAGMVLLQHAFYFAGLSIGDNVIWFRRLGFGTIGVYIFFAISGYVMVLASHETSAIQFGARRILRIYPPYIAALFFASVLFFCFGLPSPSFVFDRSLLLVPSGSLNSTFQIPYWTLIYEVFFYFVIFLLLLFRVPAIYRAWFMVFWILVILCRDFLGVKFSIAQPDIYQIFLSPANLYFIFGNLLGSLYKYQSIGPFVLASLFLAFFSHYFSLVSAGEVILILMVISIVALFIVYPSCFSGWMARGGDYSYGIYLFHLPIIYTIYYYARDEQAQFGYIFTIMMLTGGLITLFFGFLEFRFNKLLVRSLLVTR